MPRRAGRGLESAKRILMTGVPPKKYRYIIMKYRSKRSKVSKKSILWIIAAFIVAALGYILYRFSLLREGNETAPPADTTAPTAPPADTTAPADTSAPAETTAPPATTARPRRTKDPAMQAALDASSARLNDTTIQIK